jgi:glycosyltransferase involved in cell wall biosynthesis
MLGAEQVVLALCCGSRDLGYEPALAVTHDAGDGVPKLYDAAVAAGVAAYLIRCRHRFDPGAVGQLRRLLRELRIDVLHCHGYRENFYAAAAFAGVPKVTTNHLWKRTTPALKLYAWADLRLSRSFDRVVAVSQEIHAELAARGFRAPRLCYIPNGVEVERYVASAGAAASAAGSIVTLLAIGSLTAEKGHDHLLAAVQRLPDRSGVRVKIVGDGPCAAALRARANELGIGSSVEFLGRRDDVPSLLAHADVFVLPSLIEGLPIALLEAMAAGKACIATDVGDVPRAIANDVTGLLVRSADSDGLAAAIRTLVEDRELRQRLGEAARQRAVAAFSAQRMVGDYCRLYDGLFP